MSSGVVTTAADSQPVVGYTIHGFGTVRIEIRESHVLELGGSGEVRIEGQ